MSDILSHLDFKGEKHALGGEYLDKSTQQNVSAQKTFVYQPQSNEDPLQMNDTTRKIFVDNSIDQNAVQASIDAQNMIYSTSNTSFGMIKIWKNGNTLYFETNSTPLPPNEITIELTGKYLNLRPSPSDTATGSRRTLRNIYDSQSSGLSPDGKTIRFIVKSGQILGSDSTQYPQIDVGAWPTNSDLILEIEPTAYVVGKGGNGGGFNTASNQLQVAENGGNALKTSRFITVINQGTIAWGGGGGGANQDNYGYSPEFTITLGGGGGQGCSVGSQSYSLLPLAVYAEDGGLEQGGQGGHRSGYNGSGKGGDLGQSGEHGQYYTNWGLQNPGQQGYYIDGDQHINWEVKGDVRGRVK